MKLFPDIKHKEPENDIKYILIWYKNFKKDNGYNSRGNYAAARSYKNYITDYLNKKEYKYIKVIMVDIDNAKEQLKSFGASSLFGSQKFYNKILFNICFSQLIHTHDKMLPYRTPWDIYFTRQKPDLYNSIEQSLSNSFKYVSNSEQFSKQIDVKYFPRYFIHEKDIKELIETNRKNREDIYKIYKIGIYNRPEVGINQIMNLKKMVKNILKNNKDKIFILYILGSSDFYDPTFMKYNNLLDVIKTTDEVEFYSNIDMYLYYPLDENDPVPNSIIHSAYYRIKIVYQDDTKNEKFKGVNELIDKGLIVYSADEAIKSNKKSYFTYHQNKMMTSLLIEKSLDTMYNYIDERLGLEKETTKGK